MSELRLGDVIDDYCIKCKRLTNHAIVSMMDGQVAKVRCRSCYHEHHYLNEQIPPSKKDLKKQELFNAVLASADPAAATAVVQAEAEAKPVVEPEPAVAEPAPPEVAEPAPQAVAEPAPPVKKTRGRVKKI